MAETARRQTISDKANTVRDTANFSRNLSPTARRMSQKKFPQNPGDREEVIRFKNPGGTVSFNDVIHGEVTTNVDELERLYYRPLARRAGLPLRRGR
jgi:hypothetical protein